MATSAPRPFREKAAEFFTNALGTPQAVPVESGLLYRWALPRHGRTDLSIYITLDSPEMPDYAHILISDPSCGPDNEPIKSIMMKDENDFDSVLVIIRKQLDRI